METLKRYWTALVAAGIFAATGIVAEKSGGDNLLLEFVRDIWNSLKTASPPVAMVMFFLYLRADNRREETLKVLETRTAEFTEAISLGMSAMNSAAKRKRKR